MAYFRILYSFFFFTLIMSQKQAVGQLQLNDIEGIEIGKELLINRSKITGKFYSDIRVLKWEPFTSIYSVEIPNAQFANCEKAHYDLLYVFDTLSDIEVRFKFSLNDQVNEGSKFGQTIEKILSDFKSLEPKVKLASESLNIDIKRIEHYLSGLDSIRRVDYKHDKPWVYSGQNVYYSENVENPRLFFLNASIYRSSYKANDIEMEIILAYTDRKHLSYRNKFEKTGTTLIPLKNSSIDLKFKNGVYYLPVNLNGVLNLEFVLDLGAADISLSPDVFLVLLKSGTIKETDFIGDQIYQFADGSTSRSSVINLEKVKIGDIELNNVRASISKNIESPLLLGQSAFKKLGTYRIDNINQKLIVE